ncbi:MAG: tripartite tricarboxylate transporter permease [Deltaproteobacteria bacterium]|nr:MAG: tripartite tricarboxylate transporter permease [Deltaproteobacteria bacterium]
MQPDRRLFWRAPRARRQHCSVDFVCARRARAERQIPRRQGRGRRRARSRMREQLDARRRSHSDPCVRYPRQRQHGVATGSDVDRRTEPWAGNAQVTPRCHFCFLVLNHLAALTFVRGSLLIPFLLFLVFIGSFTANNDLYDIVVTLIFGAMGYFMLRFGWPRPPLVLGLTLGKIAENYLWISTAAYGAKWLLFPSVVILIAITLFTIAYPTIKERMGKAKYERPEDAV